MTETFSGFLKDLGFPLTNERWSWCAINEDRQQAIFTIWEDRLDRPHRRTIDLSSLNDPSRSELGAREFRRVMARVLNDNFTPYGVLCEAKDPTKQPRSRKGFERDLLALSVSRNDGRTIARIVGTVTQETFREARSAVDILDQKRSAIDDLGGDDIGFEQPERVIGLRYGFTRDRSVRQRVVERSQGQCEYCGVPGFKKPDGSRYIETHHIISLVQQGPDTLANVIALCPFHHREAHYGFNWKSLEEEMLAKLASLRPTSAIYRRRGNLEVHQAGIVEVGGKPISVVAEEV